MLRHVAVVALVGAMVTGCGPRTLSSPVPAQANRALLGADELALLSPTLRLDEVIRRYRPEYLAAHRGQPMVMLNHGVEGHLAALGTIPLGLVTSVRYYSGPEAAMWFGPVTGGAPVIQVVTGTRLQP